MGINYAGDVRQGHAGYIPDGWDAAPWHQSAIADTHSSHTLPGRLFIVQCLWCPEAFAANTKAKAMEMFRAHESEMLTTSYATHEPVEKILPDPDCVAGKHHNCDGTGWNETTDEPAPCPCPCHH